MSEPMIEWTTELLLVPHPAFPPPPSVRFTAEVGRLDGALYLTFWEYGDENDQLILIQPPGEGGRTDRLWEHTCFEAFVRVRNEPGYAELNFSNWGEWAAYEFDGYREGMRNLIGPSERVAGLCYKGDRGDGVYGRMYETADVFDARQDWLLNICAVAEAKDGTKSYWALAHPDGPPDFHDPACFVLELPAPR